MELTILKELLMNKFAVKRVSCFLCNNKTNLRRVTFSMHLKLPGVVPTGSGTFLDEIKERHRFYIFEVIFISEVVFTF